MTASTKIADQQLYLYLLGSPAFSAFRIAELKQGIEQKLQHKVKDVASLFVHYIKPSDGHSYDQLLNVDSELHGQLRQLLAYGDDVDLEDPSTKILQRSLPTGTGGNVNDRTVVLFVSPRKGTISPWSSKATSIAHVCGLDAVIKRIERGFVTCIEFETPFDSKDVGLFADVLHDRMTTTVTTSRPTYSDLFEESPPQPASAVKLMGSEDRLKNLQDANKFLGLALDSFEMQYLLDSFSPSGSCPRDPYDVELFMFAQVNSEHCRHKQFNAEWTIDGEKKPNSLFQMIKNTHKSNSKWTVSAYSDNAAVLEGSRATFWAPDAETKVWTASDELVHFVAKVETHNHPTAVSPYPGAATGSGGEIRDEGAVGRGSKPKAGLAGFNVSDMLIPDFKQPWELDVGRPNHIASPLDIMLEAPIGSAAFNNEFGRPCILGYFRTLTTSVPTTQDGSKKEVRGYHKPIMIAGGLGNVRPQHALKAPENVKDGAYLIVMGGPAMLIGLGGGAASSIASGESSVELDFASVQRGNPEMQRRAQMVIDACTALGDKNPIRSIHDVGAGGLSNALPELVHDADLGAKFELRDVENADGSMSPLQIWCCEAQERYVLAVSEEGMDTFKTIAARERCGYSVVGRAVDGLKDDLRLVLTDRESKENPKPIDLPMSTLFGKPPRMSRDVVSRKLPIPSIDFSAIASQNNWLDEAVNRVLSLPSVGSKSFLITIGDRSVTGLVARDQMVGPWQVPVSDVGVTAVALSGDTVAGEAMAMGERPTLALISAGASARMAVAESLTNLCAADILDGLSRVRLSANWMAAGGHEGEGAALYEAVEAIGLDLCPKLGVSIPVGKDSMSMKMKWGQNEVTAPVSLVITAFSAVGDYRKTWTPALQTTGEKTVLIFVDLALGKKELGGSALAQVYSQVGNSAPDVRDVEKFKAFFGAVEQARAKDVVLAYHDRSDGGLFTTLAEMAFAGRTGLNVQLDQIVESSKPEELLSALFNEELGAVFQVREADVEKLRDTFTTAGLQATDIIKVADVVKETGHHINVTYKGDSVFKSTRAALQQTWASTSHRMQRIRDNPACADSEFENILDDSDSGMSFQVTYDPADVSYLPPLLFVNRPCVAILREQGVNGHAEMAFAFQVAGFTPVDVHMTDLISGAVSLSSFKGIAACGGFSYGDVLGAGAGWAKSVLFHKSTREEFRAFFNDRSDTFALGVCNGCQFLSHLKSLIPGAEETWPNFERNKSEQYEARVCMVEVLDEHKSAPSVFLDGMKGSKLPIVTAHGEGQAVFRTPGTSPDKLLEKGLVCLRYVDNRGNVTEKYPANPNGSPLGITGVRSENGRVLALMPHPERTVLLGTHSYLSDEAKQWGAYGPWVRMFRSARRWVG